MAKIIQQLSNEDRERIKSEYAVSREIAEDEHSFVRKMSSKVTSIDEENHTMDFVVSTDEVDRDGERILPKSFEGTMKYYEENPVVLFGHDHKIPAVGKMIDYSIGESEVTMTDKFAVDEYAFAKLLWSLYKGEYMRMVSVGFIPLRWTTDEDMKLPGQRGRTYLENEMIEHSLVNVGSNRAALSKSLLERAYNEVPEIRKDSTLTDQFDFLMAYVESENQLSEEDYQKAAQRVKGCPHGEPGKEGPPGIATETEQVYLHKDAAGNVIGFGTEHVIHAYRKIVGDDELLGQQKQTDAGEKRDKQLEAIATKMMGLISGTYENTMQKVYNALPDYLSDMYDAYIMRGDFAVLGTTDDTVIFSMYYPESKLCKANYSIDNDKVTFSDMVEVEFPIDGIIEIMPDDPEEESGGEGVAKDDDETIKVGENVTAVTDTIGDLLKKFDSLDPEGGEKQHGTD